jgi:Rrf2 family protein
LRRSAKAEYGCLALIALAVRHTGNGPVRVKDIATAFRIPERYLVQILLQLKAAGLVLSVRGSSGGYRLARDPRRISLGEVLGAIDGPGDPPREGVGPAGQALASVWERLQAQERTFLDRISIAQLAENTAPMDWVI